MIKWVQNASRTTIAVTAIAMAIILFLCVNLISSLTIVGTRLDVTEEHIYTLTDETRNVIADVQDPITLRLYLSSSLVNSDPSVRLLSDQVIELLKTYEIMSGGMIDFQQFDPVSLSVEEDDALGYGVAPIAINVNDRAYFGLVATNTLDDIEVIPFFQAGATSDLEYELTRIVSRLSNHEYPVVGVISGLSLDQTGGGPYQFYQRLQEEFTVLNLPPDINSIPDGIDTLVVIHPYLLFDPTRYAIDQYVIRGGKALILLDPLAEQGPGTAANQQVLQYPDSYLERLMSAWGVQMASQLVVGDPTNALRVQASDGRQFAFYERFDAKEFDPDDVVTAPLHSVRFISAGALAPISGATTTFTPLVQTSAEAGFIPQSIAMQRQPPASQQAFVPGGQQVLAARITGNVTTAFPDGPPEQAEGIDTPPPELITQSVQPIDVIVVADTDFIDDDYFNGQFAGESNAVFIINAVEQLSGAADLTALRGRSVKDRPFSTIVELLQDANDQYGGRIQELTDQYNQLNLQINDLLARTPLGQATALPADLRAQYDEMVAQQLQVQRERRDLQALVRSEFDALRNNLRLSNILIVPAVVILFGILVALWRRIRLSRYLRKRQLPA